MDEQNKFEEKYGVTFFPDDFEEDYKTEPDAEETIFLWEGGALNGTE